ncbi:MAG: hypothetical protein GY874_11940 [Desulfobacteraceae bacterium]|nr:hypothetical protein [Desulfobacteraceae bacterium]
MYYAKHKSVPPNGRTEKGFSDFTAEIFFAEFDFHNLPLDVLWQPIATMVILKPSALNRHNQDTH